MDDLRKTIKYMKIFWKTALSLSSEEVNGLRSGSKPFIGQKEPDLHLFKKSNVFRKNFFERKF